MLVFLFAHTVTVFVVDAAITPTPPPTATPANTPTRSNTPADRREYDLDLLEVLTMGTLGHPDAGGMYFKLVFSSNYFASK
jgi:hypothetical protein